MCGTLHCRNEPPKGRKLCHKCRKAKQRANNPMKAAYDGTRDSAKARNIAWNLSFEDFESFAVYYKLLKGRGVTRFSWHVDRINEDDPRGYHKDNIQPARNCDNAAKENRRRRWAKLRGYLAEAGFPDIKRGPEILEPELLKVVQYEYFLNEHGQYERRGWLDKRPAKAPEPAPDEYPF